MTTIRQIALKLTENQQTLCTAESCTGGLLSKILTDISGSSAFFKAGLITYSNDAKVRFLKVPILLIKKHGAVSAPVVRAMAQGARMATGTDFSVAVTGIAGPAGGTPAKPIGLVFIAVTSSRKVIIKRFIFKGNRRLVRCQASDQALSMLLNLLNNQRQ